MKDVEAQATGLEGDYKSPQSFGDENCGAEAVTNWHFSRSFRLNFHNTYDPFPFKILSYQHNYTRFKPFRLFTLFTDNQKTHVLKPIT